MTTLADGCCSAVTPCSWQRTNPSTICDTCRAASPSVSAWLEQQEKNCYAAAETYDTGSPSDIWFQAQARAFEVAHAYAVARPDRTVAPTLKLNDLSVFLRKKRDEALVISERFDVGSHEHGMRVAQASAFGEAASAADNLELAKVSPPASITDADLTYLADLAISSKDATLARIAAALLLAR